jgi:hypothetical protein
LTTAFVRIAIASALMGMAAMLIERALAWAMPGASVAVQALRLGTAIGAALVVLAGAAHLLRIREFTEAFALVVQRVRRTP